jgi:hypothetical protein
MQLKWMPNMRIPAVRFVVLLLVMIVTVLLAYFIMNFSAILPLDTKISTMNSVDELLIGGVQGDVILTQTFKTKVDIDKVGVRMVTYGKTIPGEIYVRVYDYETEETLSEMTYPASNIFDNSFNEFVLQRVIPGGNKTYALEISGTTPNLNESIGVWCTKHDVYSGGNLIISDFDFDGDMNFYLSSVKRVNQTWPILLSIFISLVLAGLLAFFIRINLRKERKE